MAEAPDLGGEVLRNQAANNPYNTVSKGAEDATAWATSMAHTQLQSQSIMAQLAQHKSMKEEVDAKINKQIYDQYKSFARLDNKSQLKRTLSDQWSEAYIKTGHLTPESAERFKAAAFDPSIQEGVDKFEEAMSNLKDPEIAKKIWASIKMGVGPEDPNFLEKIADHVISANAMVEAAAKRGGVAAASLEERRNVHAGNAGQAFEKDPILTTAKKTRNSLGRAMSLLNGTEPVTGKTFNIVMNDMINAMTQDNRATEGKIKRENIDTLQGMWNDAMLKGGKVKDLRKSVPDIIKNIGGVMKQIDTDYADALGTQALNIHDSFKESTNPKVKETIKNKLKSYSPEAFAKTYPEEAAGTEKPQPRQKPLPDYKAPKSANYTKFKTLLSSNPGAKAKIMQRAKEVLPPEEFKAFLQEK